MLRLIISAIDIDLERGYMTKKKKRKKEKRLFACCLTIFRQKLHYRSDKWGSERDWKRDSGRDSSLNGEGFEVASRLGKSFTARRRVSVMRARVFSLLDGSNWVTISNPYSFRGPTIDHRSKAVEKIFNLFLVLCHREKNEIFPDDVLFLAHAILKNIEAVSSHQKNRSSRFVYEPKTKKKKSAAMFFFVFISGKFSNY